MRRLMRTSPSECRLFSRGPDQQYVESLPMIRFQLRVNRWALPRYREVRRAQLLFALGPISLCKVTLEPPDFNKETPPLRRRLPGESNCPRRLQRPIGRPHSLRQRPAPAPTERQLRLKPHPASPKRQDPRPPGTPSTPPPSGRPAATIHPEALCLRGSALPTPGWTFSPRPAPPNRVPANHRPARPLSPAKPEAPARNPSPYLDDEDLSTLAALLCSPRESMSPEPPSASPQTTRFSQRPHPFHS